MHLLLSLQPLRPLLFPQLARYLLAPPHLPRSLQPFNIRLTLLWLEPPCPSRLAPQDCSTEAVEWMSWKKHYLEVCEINAWPNIRRVREAWAAMAEKAARHTADVVPVYVANPPVQITTWQDLIARYQEKFMPPAAGVYSRGVQHS
jgi:hypothetical protein